MNLVTVIVSLLTGIFASLGLGGGMVLIVWLTVFEKMPQLNAQGINLIFFIPIAIISLIFHTKNGLVEWKKTVPVLIAGTVAVIAFGLLASSLDGTLLRRLFGGFVIIFGIHELFAKDNTQQ